MYPGFGKRITGGDDGTFIHVSTLEDDVPGSLRWAIERAEEPTTILFSVKGRIKLKRDLSIVRKSNLTIDGEYKIDITTYRVLVAGCDNIILKRLRHRLGREVYDATGRRSDCFEVFRSGTVPSTRVALDRCSAAFWSDEGITIASSSECVMINCILGYGLNIDNHALPSIVKGDKIGVYGCLFAHAIYRPSIGGKVQLAHNTYYNYTTSDPNIVHSVGIWPADKTQVDIVDSMYIGGPSTTNNTPQSFRSIRVTHNDCSLHQSGNKVYLRGSDTEHDVVVRADSGVTYEAPDNPHYIPVDLNGSDIQPSDAVDLQIVNDVRQGTGKIILDPSEVGWQQ